MVALCISAGITMGINIISNIPSVLVMPDTLIKPDILTVSPLSPNTLRILVLVEASADGSAINLSAIADANNSTGGFVINGEAADDRSGYSVSSAGDINGDGLDDLIVGAWGSEIWTGKSYGAPTIKSSKPSPLTSPALETE
jgi:hypothetical protein